MGSTISKNEIIQKLAESIGMEKATSLVTEAALACHYQAKSDFTSGEAIEVLDKLKQQGGIIKIIATFLNAEIQRQNL